VQVARLIRGSRPAPICTKSAKRTTITTGALHQSHFSNTEDTGNNRNVGRLMRVPALSLEMETAPTGNNRIERGHPEQRCTEKRAGHCQLLHGLSRVGHSSALDGMLRKILRHDSNDIVSWCNVALRRVRCHRHADFGSRVGSALKCGNSPQRRDVLWRLLRNDTRRGC
jgi:hypothetical protein